MKFQRPTLAFAFALLSIGSLLACAHPEKAATSAASDATAAADAAREETESAVKDASQVSLGNGESNWIVTEGMTHAGKTFTFKEVHIDGNGWLVLHPFENGKPNGKIFSAASYLKSGNNRNVDVSLDILPESGDMFIVMLHRDVNEDQVFDFIFVDEQNVLDKAVFEGMTMIAHAIKTP